MGILRIDLDSAIKMPKFTFLKNGDKILPIMQCKVSNRKWGQNQLKNGLKWL